jgi:hypothetical protein
MIPALAIAAGLIVLTVALHYETIRLIIGLQRRRELSPRIEVLALISASLLAHLFSISIYAAAFAWMHDHPDFGALEGRIGAEAADFFYFSLTCYTTLGFGDVYATGPMRIIAGLEALNGLVLIAWSASSTFVSIERMWRRD